MNALSEEAGHSRPKVYLRREGGRHLAGLLGACRAEGFQAAPSPAFVSLKSGHIRGQYEKSSRAMMGSTESCFVQWVNELLSCCSGRGIFMCARLSGPCLAACDTLVMKVSRKTKNNTGYNRHNKTAQPQWAPPSVMETILSPSSPPFYTLVFVKRYHLLVLIEAIIPRRDLSGVFITSTDVESFTLTQGTLINTESDVRGSLLHEEGY